MKNKYLNYLIIGLVLIILVIVAFLIYNANKEITFTIVEEKMYIKIDETKKIKYTINDSSVDITWNSNNPNIASVDDSGIVTAISEGVALITGTAKDKTITCIIIVRPSNYDIVLEDAILPDGEILLSTNQSYSIPLTLIPSDGYVEKIDYYIEDESIISVENNTITALTTGYTTLTITINKTISKQIIVNVTDNEVLDNIIKPINEIIVNEENVIYVGENKILNYSIEPSDGIVFDHHFEINNPDIAIVDDNGIITGLKNGQTILELTINNRIRKSINITIKNKIQDIKLDYNPKQLLKIGDTFKLYPTVVPSNIENIKLIYSSSNPNSLSVDEKGKVKAINTGTATITIQNEDGSVSKKISFTILKDKGLINSDKIVWAYSKSTDVTPKRADINFFNNLAKNGRGIVSGNNYIYQKYSYNINTNLLTINNTGKIFMRIYYPPNKDLSTLNTFTFIGGVGEENFNGLFYKYDRNPSLLNTSGILIFIPESNYAKVQGINVIEATNFVKLIINQNKHARNNLGGYSNGGPPCGDAADKGQYNKLMLIDTSFYWVKTRPNVKNLEYVIYSPQGDSWIGGGSFILELYNFGVKNVTVVTNNNDFVNTFKDKYLVINPGKSMKNGHTPENLILSHYFSLACD